MSTIPKATRASSTSSTGRSPDAKPLPRWTAANIPSQRGRFVVITGTGGIGFEDALALTQAGADVILAGRNPAKGAAAIEKIRSTGPKGTIHFEVLDLANFGSIKAFAERMQAQHEKLDLLINNAAVMAPPRRQLTSNGFELQFGTNYLGHFALTAALLPLLRQGKNARVINVSSVAARDGVMNFDDLQSARQYRPMVAYGQSKLANLMFSLELQQRSDANRWGVTSIAAHPGISRTELIPNGAGRNSLQGVVRQVLGPVLFQSPAQGALPTLFAATSPEAKGGAYYGPRGLGETRGLPAVAKMPPRAENAPEAAQLWEVSERLSGVWFEDPKTR